MMNKQMIIVALIAIGLIVGGVALLGGNESSTAKNDTSDVVNMNSEADTEQDASDESSIEDEAADDMSEEMVAGAYISYEDYKSNTAMYQDADKIIFFHAGWCPTCRGIENEINEDISRIPDNTVIIKTDFDSSTELRQKYGVTVQSTFVQIDNDLNETAQWTASDLDDVIAAIE